MIWAKYLFTQLFSETEADDESGILEVNHLNKNDPDDIFRKIFDTDVRLLAKDLTYISLDEFDFLPLPPKSRI